jgi:hypothetical protein
VAALADLVVAGAEGEGEGEEEGGGYSLPAKHEQQQAGIQQEQRQQDQQQRGSQASSPFGQAGQQGDNSTLEAGGKGQEEAPAQRSALQDQGHAAQVTHLDQLYMDVVCRHSLLPAGGGGLEGLQALGGGGAVGGRLAGYVSAQLLAAWAWSAGGVQGAVEDWAQQQQQQHQGVVDKEHHQQQQQEVGGRSKPAAARFKAGVLRAGSSLPAQVALALGALGDPAALQPVAGEDGQVVGWVVDLEAAAAAADLELLA